MNSRSYCVKIWSSALAVTLCALGAFAANGTWSSTAPGANNSWTNSLNWSASPAPYGTEAALFNNAGNGQTSLDVTGLSFIKYITFDTPSAAAYSIGAGAANSQTLVLADSGEISMAATAGNSQTFNCGVQLGLDRTAQYYALRNDNPAQSLTFNDLFFTAVDSGATTGTKTVNIDGAGPVNLLGGLRMNGASAVYLNVNNSSTVTLAGSNTVTQLNMYGGPGSVLDIGDKELYLSSGGGNNLNCYQGGRITGSGKLKLSTTDGLTSGGYNYADLNIVVGRTLVVDASITGLGGIEMWSGAGNIVLNGVNTFEGHICIGTAGSLYASSVGNRGSLTSNLGQGTNIVFNTTGKFVYTGTGESSDRIIVLNSTGTLEQSGPSGKLTFTASPVLTGASRQLTLQGSSPGVGEFSAPLVNSGGNILNVVKNGSGTWMLSGTNTYGSTTTVNGGKLVVSGSGILSGGNTVTVNAGATLAGSGTINTNVAISAGGILAPGDVNAVGTLNVTKGLVLTSATLQYDLVSPDTLNVATDKVAVAGALTLNGTNTVAISFPSNAVPEGSYTLMTFASRTGAGFFTLVTEYPNVSLFTNATTVRLDVGPGGASSALWKGSATDKWDDTDPNLNWTSNGVAVAFTPGAQAAFDDSASIFSVASLAPVVPGSVTFNNSLNDYTVSAAIDGTGVVYKLGSGAVTLTGNNTYTGVTTVASGTLKLGGAGVMGGGNYGTNLVNNGEFVFDSSAAQTNSGVVSGGGNLTVSGSGSLTLSGYNNYLGLTVVTNGGLLRAGHNSALGSTSVGTVIASGGNLELALSPTGGLYAAEALELRGTLSSKSVGTNSFGGVITMYNNATLDVGAGSYLFVTANTPDIGSNKVTKTGSGTLRFVGDPNHRSIFVVGEGTVELAHTGSTDAPWVINPAGTLCLFSGAPLGNNYPVENNGTFDVRVNNTIGGFSGSGLVTNGGASAATLTVGNNNQSGVFSGVFRNGNAATLALAKNGSSFLTLSGANTHSGGTQINAGQMNINHASALGAGAFTLAGGVTIDNTSGADITLAPSIPVNWNGDFTFVGSKSLNLGAGAVTMNADRTVNVLTNTLTMGAVGQSGTTRRLIKNGAGALVITGVSTYTGATTVNGGSLILASPGSLHASSAVTANPGALFGGNGTVNGTMTCVTNSLLAPGGVGSVGTLTVANASATALTLQGATLLVDLSNVAGVSDRVALTGAGSKVVLTAANKIALSLPANGVPAGTYTLISSLAGITTNAGASISLLTSYPNATLRQDVNSIVLDVTGPGIPGVTWTGSTSGTWDGGDQNWSDGTSPVTYPAGAAVTFDDTAVGNFSVSGGAVSPAAVLVNNSANDYAFSAVLSGTGPLTKQGSAQLTLSGMTAYNPGMIALNNGVLTFGGASQLNGGSYAGNIFDNGNLAYASSAAQTWSGMVSGYGCLTKYGNGVLTLAGSNLYSGATIVDAGVLKTTHAYGLGTTTAGTFVNQNGTLEFANNVNSAGEAVTLYGTLSSQTGSNTCNGTVTLYAGSAINVGAGSTLVLKGFQANGAFTKTGAGWLKFTSDPNGVGVMTVASGVAELNAIAMDANIVVKAGAMLVETMASAVNDANRVTVEAGGVYRLHAYDRINALSGAGTVTRDLIGLATLEIYNNNNQFDTFSGVIEDGKGALSFTKYGYGDFTLSGACTYTGPTLVSGGGLYVNSPGSLGESSLVTVNSLFGGNGTVNGAVAMNAGGSLVPGALGTIGTLTIGKTLSLNGNVLTFDLPASGTVCDSVAVGGALALNGVNSVALAFPAGAAQAGVYTLMTFPSYSGSGSFVLAGSYPNATLTLNATSLELTVTAGGTDALTWSGGASIVWNASTLNWRIGGAASAFANGDAVLFDDTAAQFTVVSGGAVSPSAVSFNNSALNPYVLTSPIIGACPIVKSGAGTVSLNNVDAINPAAILVNSGTLSLGGGSRLNSGTYANPIVTHGVFTHNSSGTQTFNGQVSGVGQLTKTGSGTLTLTAGNTYSGGTTLTAGTLNGRGVTNAFGTGTLTLSGGTVDFQNDTPMTFVNNVSLNSGTTVKAGRVTAGAGLTHTLGTLTITGNTLTLSPGANVNNNTAYGATFSNVTITASTANFTVNNNGTGLGTLTLGVLSGNFSFAKLNAGVLYLPYASARSGGTSQLVGGTLKLGNGAALGTTGTALALNGGTLELACDASVPAINTSMWSPLPGVTIMSGRATANSEGITHTLGTLSFGCPVIVTNNANVRANSTFGLAFGATTLTNAAFFDVGNNGTGLGLVTLGAVSGNYSLTKRGLGTLKLAGINTSAADITNRNGRLLVVTGGSSSNSAVIVQSSENVAAAAKLGVLCNVANTRWVCNSLTFTNTAPAITNPTLEFLFGVAPSTTVAPLQSLGTCTFGPTPPSVIVNLSSAGTVAPGTYPLMTVGGTAPVIPPLLTMVGGYNGSFLMWSGNTLNLTVSGLPSPLTWGATGSGVWDLNNSLNTIWKDNAGSSAYYGEQAGSDAPGSRVLFDDSYITADTVVTLNSFVNPASIAISNSLYTYTISGTGAIAGTNALVKAGTNLLTLATANTYAGGTVVAGGTLRVASGGAINHAASDVLVGTVPFTNALLKIESGAMVSNRWMSIGTNGATAAVHNQGLLALSGASNLANFPVGFGANSYGYYRHDSPTLLGVQEMAAGGGSGGNGVIDVLQGAVTNGTFFFINRGNSAQYGQVNVSGGRLIMPNSNANAAFYWQSGATGQAILNVNNGGLVGSAGTITELDLIKVATGATAFGALNILSAGTVQATKVKASQGAGTALVNFDGGTLKAGNNSVILLGGSNIDRATVYAGGATVDTDGRYVAITQPLLAPTGSGVTAIPLTASGTGYIGRPIVSITGGGGTGATALADFNPVSGEVTGVTVTSPGYGYTSAPAVSFTGGGGVAPTVGSVAIGAVASGGLTKSGNGTLTLSGACTYGGGTTVSNGTLRLGVANALPTNSPITVVNGSTLDLNGYTVTNSSLAVLSGSVINGSVVAPTLPSLDAGVIQARVTATNSGLTKSGSSVLTIGAALTYSGATEINGGTVKLVGSKPGLYEGRSTVNSFDLTSQNPATATPLSARAAYMMFNSSGESGGFWVDNSTYIYSGYVWNNSATNETWSFCKAFDDNARLRINGATVFQNQIWSDLVISNATLYPGANSFELRLGQGGGGAGATGANAGFTGFGFGFDRLGRGQNVLANFQALTDPGDGSLLTLTNVFDLANANLLSTNTALSIAAGALLDLGGTGQKLTGLAGSGTVSNGMLTVSGTIAPGGLNTLGTLALPDVSATLSGTLRIDVSDDGSCDVLAVGGDLSLSGLALQVDNGGLLNPSHVYTIMTCAGTRTGTFSSKNAPSGWIVYYEPNGDVKLKYVGGTLIRVR